MGLAADTPSSIEPAVGAPSRRTVTAVALFVAWTLFVWLGRVRNAVSDTALSVDERRGPLLLASLFVIAASALAVLCVVRVRRPHDRRSAGALAATLGVAAAVTTVVWVLRAGDIALGGDHDAGFVLVHVALAVVSIGLAAWAWASDRSDRRVTGSVAGATRR